MIDVKQHEWALSKEALELIREWKQTGVDYNLAFELVALTLPEDKMYILEEIDG